MAAENMSDVQEELYGSASLTNFSFGKKNFRYSCESGEDDETAFVAKEPPKKKKRVGNPTITRPTGSSSSRSSSSSSSHETNGEKDQKFRWTEAMITDMVDIVASTSFLRKYLIFENHKNSSNGKHYEMLVEGLNKRISAYETPGPLVNANQARTKFKKIMGECRSVSLTIRTSSGIDRHKVEKGYGKWWDVLFKLVASKPSSDPTNNVEPTFGLFQEEEDEAAGPSQKNTSTQTPPKQKKIIPKRPNGQQSSKSSTFRANLMSTLNKFVENDPTKDMMELIKSENEKARKHEMELMEKLVLLSAPRPTVFNPGQQHYHNQPKHYSGQSSYFQNQLQMRQNQGFSQDSQSSPIPFQMTDIPFTDSNTNSSFGEQQSTSSFYEM